MDSPGKKPICSCTLRKFHTSLMSLKSDNMITLSLYDGNILLSNILNTIKLTNNDISNKVPIMKIDITKYFKILTKLINISDSETIICFHYETKLEIRFILRRRNPEIDQDIELLPGSPLLEEIGNLSIFI